MTNIDDIIMELDSDGTPDCSVLEVIECLEQARDTISDLETEVDELKTDLHYCNGVSDLAMKHRDLAEAKVEELTVELGNFNTFSACKMHSNHSSLRCAICDENKLIKLQAKIKKAGDILAEHQTMTAPTYLFNAIAALNRECVGIQDMMAEVEALSQEVKDDNSNVG